MGQGVDADGFGWQLSASSTSGTVITSGGQPIGADLSDEEDGAQKPLPERLVMELAAHRSLALREAIGRSPEVALALLLLKLVMDNRPHLLCLGRLSRNSVRHVYISAQAHDLKDSVVARLIDQRHAAWEADLPLGHDAALWEYLTVLDQGSRQAPLAHCLCFGTNANYEKKVNSYGAGISASGLTRRMAHANLVARVLNLDMVEAGSEPTVDGYFNRVSKVRILDAVREAKDEGTAQLLDHLKKGEMATEAERLLKDSGQAPDFGNGEFPIKHFQARAFIRRGVDGLRQSSFVAHLGPAFV